MSKRIFSLALLLIMTLTLFPSCGKTSTGRLFKRTETDLFDTVCTFTAQGPEEKFNSTADLLFDTLARLDLLFDIYEEKEGTNNLCTVNKMAGSTPVKVDPLLIDFFLYINNLPSDLTNLAHPMLGAVTLLWKEGQKAGVPPEQAELDHAKSHVDPSALVVNSKESTLFISDPDARIDVGAFAKGYAAKLCVALLEKQQVSNYLLYLGGSIYARGVDPRTNAPWSIGIQNPFISEDLALLSVNLTDCSLTTSGSYRRFFTHEGQSYHHIIDPTTGMPSGRCDTLSLTVTAADPALADVLSTVLFILPPSEGRALLAESQICTLDPSLSALWIDPSGTIIQTEGFPKESAPAQSSRDATVAALILASLCIVVSLLLIMRKKETIRSFVKGHPSFFSRKNLIFLSLVAIVCILLLGSLFFFPKSSNTVAVVRYKGEIVKTLPLAENTDYLFRCTEGENLIRVEGGRIYVASASCKGQDCVHTDPLSKSRQLSIIACLPHSLTITLEQGEEYE